MPDSRWPSWKVSERWSVRQPPWAGGQTGGRICLCQQAEEGVSWHGKVAAFPCLGLLASLWPWSQEAQALSFDLLEET